MTIPNKYDIISMSRGNERRQKPQLKVRPQRRYVDNAVVVLESKNNEKILRKPLDKYIRVWYNIYTKEREEILMRVTKLIREYVEETVSAMPKFANLTPEEQEYKTLQSNITDFQNAVDKEVDESVAEAIEKFRTTHNLSADIRLEVSCHTKISWSTYGSDLAGKARDAERERKEARDNAIKEILLNLELGADRKELDEMLKKLAE